MNTKGPFPALVQKTGLHSLRYAVEDNTAVLLNKKTTCLEIQNWAPRNCHGLTVDSLFL